MIFSGFPGRQLLLLVTVLVACACDSGGMVVQQPTGDPPSEDPAPLTGEVVFTVKYPGDRVAIFRGRLSDPRSTRVELPTISAFPWNPRYSHDGEQIFYSNYVKDEGGYQALRRLDLLSDTDSLVRAIEFGREIELYPVMSSLAPSESGEALYFNQYADFGSPKPVEYNLNTKEFEFKRQAIGYHFASEMSPDSLLMFVWLWEADEFVVVDRQGIEKHRFPIPASVGTAEIQSAQWNPSTREILFDFASESYPRWSVGIFDTVGGEVRVVPTDQFVSYDRFPRWGPRNSILFLRSASPGFGLAGSSLMLFNPLDSTVTELLSPSDIGSTVEYIGQFDFFDRP